MSEENTTPTLQEVLKRAMDVRLGELHTGIVARILSYNGDRNTCTAQPVTKWRRVGEDGSARAVSHSAIGNVPVFMLHGGTARITMPVAAGDFCWLAFAEQSLDRWKAVGGEVDPRDFRRFDMSDAFAIVGLHPPGRSFVVPSDRMTIGYEAGPKIHIDGDSIRLASNAASRGVARVNDTVLVRKLDLEAAIADYLTFGVIVGDVHGDISSGAADVLA